MGKGRSSNGGGARDNSRWAEDGVTGGFHSYTDADEIQKKIGNEAWEERLTEDEEHALDMYMNRDYAFRRMNGALRDPDGAPADEQTQALIDDLGSALDKSYLKENVIVTRRSDASLLGGADTAAQVREMYGDVVVDPGFASASAKADYTAFKNTRPMEYHIKVPGRQSGVGAYVQNFAESKNEYEFLFNRGASFRVLGAYEQGGKTHVNMEWVGRTAR